MKLGQRTGFRYSLPDEKIGRVQTCRSILAAKKKAKD